MKKLFLIASVSLAFLLSACMTENYAFYDDVYSSSSDAQYKSAVASKGLSESNAKTTELQPDSIVYEYDEEGNLLRTQSFYAGMSEPVVKNYMVESPTYTLSSYNDDDYYDYYYTSRLRRFHTGINYGWSYYDPWYTNTYWYDYNPYSWGYSIYLGYNWWWPSCYVRPYYYGYDYWGFNYGWGWGYYDPFHYHHFHPWHHHHHGHFGHFDYWNHPGCHWASNFYHNNHDQNNTFHYGHRESIGLSVGNGRHRERDLEHNVFGSTYTNNDNNNRYSTVSSPASFNQTYQTMAATHSALPPSSDKSG